MNPTYDFTGQVTLVTGGSSGMGLAHRFDPDRRKSFSSRV
jgi:short-subunit dehydrogenase involved in D-alanine esterification of teichoic acids